MDDEEEEDSDDADEDEDEDSGDEDSDGAAPGDEFESDDDDSEDGDEEEMAVEKASKKLDKKQKRLEASANEDLQVLMSQREVFQLPSGQEVEKEAAQPPDLQIIQARIKDVVDVLKDFANKRAEGSSRQEYLECLRRDLCSYYNYNGNITSYK